MRVVTTYVERDVKFYWISFGKWYTMNGVMFIRERIYSRGKWTPFVKMYKRHDTWFGHYNNNKNNEE